MRVFAYVLVACGVLVASELYHRYMLGEGGGPSSGLHQAGVATGSSTIVSEVPSRVDEPKTGQLNDVQFTEDQLVELDEIVSAESLGLRGPNGLASGYTNGSSGGLPGEGGPFLGLIRSSQRQRSTSRRVEDDQEIDPSRPNVNFREILSPFVDQQRNSDQIFGVRVQGAAAPVVGEQSTSQPLQSVGEPTPFPELPWVSGQARGYTMLYALQPSARPVVEANITALLESRIREPYIGVLIDGTFGRDFAYLRNIIDRLSQDGRRLTLGLFLTNGPAMRRSSDIGGATPFARIDPIAFRGLIRSDRETRGRFSTLVNDAAQIFRYNRDAHPDNQNVVTIMLEDNLDRDSYRAMRALATNSLGRVAQFVRNPCVGCFDGNDGDSVGDSREEHTLARYPTLNRGDAFSFDGLSFSYPGSNELPGELPGEQLAELMRDSLSKQLRYVGLWRYGWQGIVPGQNIRPTAERAYIPSSLAQQAFEAETLRVGLAEERPENSTGLE